MLKFRYPKTVLILATLTGASAAFGQAASIYGLIDVGVESVNNVSTGVGTNTASLQRVPTNTNTAPSRLGVRGSVDVGDGMSVVYTAEAGIDPGNGTSNQGGRLFGRQVYAGLSSVIGTVSVGRQYTMTFWSGLNADILGGGIYGTGSLDSYLPNARADNSIVWMKRTNGWTLGADYSFGRDAVANSTPNPASTNCLGESTDLSACRQWSAMVKYDTPTWGVATAHDRLMGGTGAFGGLTDGSMADTRTTLNGWVMAGTVKIGGGVIRRSNDGTASAAQGSQSTLSHLGFVMPVGGKWTLSAQYVALSYSANSDYNAQLMAVRGTYDLFKGAELYGQIGDIQNGSASKLSVSGGATGSSPLAGGSQQAVNFGFKYAF